MAIYSLFVSDVFAVESQEALLKDQFINLSSDWNVLSNSPNKAFVDSSFGYKSNSSLVLDYVDGKSSINLTRNLNNSHTEVLVRVFFYDDMDDSLGTIFTVGSSDSQPNSDIPFHTSIGVITTASKEYYVVRHNSYAGTFVTDVKRTKGWHMFEFIVTGLGVYCKIDNEIIFKRVDGDNFSPLVNESQKDLKVLGIISTWGLLGRARYDELSIVKPFQGEWKNYSKLLSAYHYNIYRDIDLSVLLNTSLYDDNILRGLLDTATAFYLYGKSDNNNEAVHKGLELFRKVLDDSRWRKTNDWQLGVKMGLLLQNALFLWDDLDTYSRSKVLNLVYDRVYEYFNPNFAFKDPKSGYKGDSKAEENSWNAYFLAQAANYLPDFPKQKEVEEKARCFAYHSITTGESKCGVSTQTVYNNFLLENHGFPHPVYAVATIHQLAIGAMSYVKAGKPIPEEFKHNVGNLYEKFIKERLDVNSFHTKNSPKPDWLGAHRSLFVGFVGFEYLRKLGVNLGFDMGDFKKMSLFYYDTPCVWIMDLQQLQNQKDAFSLVMFLNSIYAGGYAGTISNMDVVRYSSLPLKVCEDNIFKEKVWTPGGGITWNCDSGVKKIGNTSIVISSDNPVDAELYSPLIEVAPNKEYNVSYWVKTQNLQPSDSKVYGRIIVAQYNDKVIETDDVSTDKRIDPGFSLGDNVSGTNDWIKKTYSFRTTGQTKYIRLRAPLGLQGKAKGRVYFDDVVVKAKDIKSDLNNDGKVDIFDYNILVSNFGKSGSPGWIPADINKDGKVDIFDYNILVSEFGSFR